MNSQQKKRKPLKVLDYNGEQMPESSACRCAGVSWPWYLKNLSDESRMLGHAPSDTERQNVFNRLVEDANRFREKGLMKLHRAQWVRVSDDAASYLQQLSETRGVAVWKALDELITSHKKGS